MSAPIKTYLLQSDHWGTSQFKLKDLDASVTSLHFVAEENVDNEGSDGQPPTNHWAIFLSTGPNTSVRLEMAPAEPGEPGMVIVESMTCALSSAITHSVTMAPSEPITVAHVLDTITSNHRDEYVFAPIGEGCRFWMFTLADDLDIAGIIPSAAAQKVRFAVTKYWAYPAGSGCVNRPMAKGSFPKRSQGGA
jgi:hypothetical protein